MPRNRRSDHAVKVPQVKLRRLEPVNVRDIWPNEEEYFTPWLASEEGLALLSEWVGIPLTHARREVNVGQFRADILCTEVSDPANTATVVIENQLGPSDHDHLGKLLTYAFGTQAAIGIWIATDFAPEHLEAIRAWNQPPDRPVSIYCVQVSAWRIGQSHTAAATFNVLVRPDSPNAAAPRLVPTADLAGILNQFWSRFHKEMAKGPGWKLRHAKNPTYMSYEIGDRRACLSVVREAGRNRARLYIFRGNESLFKALKRYRGAINRELGEPVWWSSNDRRSSIDLSGPAHLYDRSKWDEEIEWMSDKLQLLDRVFRHRLRAIPLDEPSVPRSKT